VVSDQTPGPQGGRVYVARMLRLARFVSLASTGVLAGLLVDVWLSAGPVLYIVVNVSALVVVILLSRGSGIAFSLSAAGLLCAAVATAVTLLMPGDRVFTDEIRTGLMLAAFAFQLLAVLSTPRRPA
jgi:hypothetical protein